MYSLRLAVLACAALFLVPTSKAATVDYTTLGPDFQTPALVFGGITVTGSANVHVQNFNGLGIVGGSVIIPGQENFYVDGNEFIDFAFDAPAANVSYFAATAVNGNADSTVGDRFLEAFGIGGTSLGIAAQNDAGIYLVSALFGNALIERFRLTANVDAFRLNSVSYDVATVPLPAALPLFGSALAAIGIFRWWRRRQTT